MHNFEYNNQSEVLFEELHCSKCVYYYTISDFCFWIYQIYLEASCDALSIFKMYTNNQ